MGSTPATILQPAVLIIGIALCLLGILLIRRFWFPRRKGQTQHCKKCNYNLQGLQSTQCPECGLNLTPSNIVQGQRHRRPTLAVFAIFLLLLGVTATLLSQSERIQKINWYAYKPAAWVIADLKSSDTALYDRAWNEISNRIEGHRLSADQELQLRSTGIEVVANSNPGTKNDLLDYLFARYDDLSPPQRDVVFDELVRLCFSQSLPFGSARIDDLYDRMLISPSQENRLIETALKVQAGSSRSLMTDYFVTTLGNRATRNQLTPAQRERFFNQAMTISLQVRPVVYAGDTLPYRIEVNGNAPHGGWCSTNRVIDVQIDDKTVEHLGQHGWTFGFASAAGGGEIDVSQPGKHVLKIIQEVAAYASETDPPPPPAAWQKTVTLTAPFTVLPAADKSKIELNTDPATASALRSAITFDQNSFYGNQAAVTVQIRSCPANISFAVFARLDGKEYNFGNVTCKVGKSNNIVLASPKEFPAKGPSKNVDLLFRPNPAWARHTVDLFQIWSGELTFPDVPLAYPADVNKQ